MISRILIFIFILQCILSTYGLSRFILSQLLISDLQHRLDLGRDIGLLVELDALFVGPARALHCDLLQVGQHHTVSLGHCLELVEQKLQQFQQQPVEGARESGREGRR